MALAVGSVATLVFVGATALSYYADEFTGTNLVMVLLGIVLLIATWGVARRHKRGWVPGLVVASAVTLLLHRVPSPYTWFGYWLLWVATFAIGCCAWFVLEFAVFSRSRRSPAATNS